MRTAREASLAVASRTIQYTVITIKPFTYKRQIKLFANENYEVKLGLLGFFPILRVSHTSLAKLAWQFRPRQTIRRGFA